MTGMRGIARPERPRARPIGAMLGPLAASLAMVAAMLAVRIWAGVPSLPELVEDRLLLLVPGELFSLGLERLQFAGKPLLLFGLLIAQLAAGLVGAVLLYRLLWSRRRRWSAPASVAAGAALGLALGWAIWAGLAPVADASEHLPVALGELRGWLAALPYLVYGLAVALFAPADPHSAPVERAQGAVLAASRRRVLEMALSGLSVLVVAGALRQLLGAGADAPTARKAEGTASGAEPGPDTLPTALGSAPAAAAAIVPPLGLALPPGVSPRVTSTPDFYVVSKNFVDPVVQADGWTLEVTGLVDRPLTLSYADLLGLPAQEVERTLECISNPIGGRLISNAVWRGAPLSDLLERVGVRPEAVEAIFTSADNYLEHLPLDKLRQGTTLMAHTINGEPLPSKHGFPVRLLTTGLYGMKNPKWLRKIELADRTERSYWERRGWTPTAPIRTTARSDAPKVGQRATEPDLQVGGSPLPATAASSTSRSASMRARAGRPRPWSRTSPLRPGCAGQPRSSCPTALRAS